MSIDRKKEPRGDRGRESLFREEKKRTIEAKDLANSLGENDLQFYSLSSNRD